MIDVIKIQKHLKPCPKCNGEAEVFTQDDCNSARIYLIAKCNCCGIKSSLCGYESYLKPEELVTDWNYRELDDKIVQLLAYLRNRTDGNEQGVGIYEDCTLQEEVEMLLERMGYGESIKQKKSA